MLSVTVTTSSNHLPFSVLNSGEKKRVTWDHVWKVWQLTHLWKCGVWLKIAAQVGVSAQECCHDEFAKYQTNIFLVIYGKLHYDGIFILLNNNGGLKFHLVECIQTVKYLLGGGGGGWAKNK